MWGSKGVFWRPGCFQIFVKNLDGKRGSCITEAVTAVAAASDDGESSGVDELLANFGLAKMELF